MLCLQTLDTGTTCNIFKKVVTVTDGEEAKPVSNLYTGISCKILKIWGKRYDTTLGMVTDTGEVEIMIGDKIDPVIQRGYFVEIFDKDTGSMGTYVIDKVPMLNRFMGQVSNIVLKLKIYED